MTKQVRIENADTAPYKVLVEVWDKGYLTSTRYLVVKEAPAGS